MWPSDIVGGLLWAVGFTIETTADFQKFAFKQNPANKGRFISTGNPPNWRLWGQMPPPLPKTRVSLGNQLPF